MRYLNDRNKIKNLLTGKVGDILISSSKGVPIWINGEKVLQKEKELELEKQNKMSEWLKEQGF